MDLDLLAQLLDNQSDPNADPEESNLMVEMLRMDDINRRASLPRAAVSSEEPLPESDTATEAFTETIEPDEAPETVTEPVTVASETVAPDAAPSPVLVSESEPATPAAVDVFEGDEASPVQADAFAGADAKAMATADDAGPEANVSASLTSSVDDAVPFIPELSEGDPASPAEVFTAEEGPTAEATDVVESTGAEAAAKESSPDAGVDAVPTVFEAQHGVDAEPADVFTSDSLEAQPAGADISEGTPASATAALMEEGVEVASIPSSSGATTMIVPESIGVTNFDEMLRALDRDVIHVPAMAGDGELQIPSASEIEEEFQVQGSSLEPTSELATRMLSGLASSDIDWGRRQ